jgi:hypothetical protein
MEPFPKAMSHGANRARDVLRMPVVFGDGYIGLGHNHHSLFSQVSVRADGAQSTKAKAASSDGCLCFSLGGSPALRRGESSCRSFRRDGVGEHLVQKVPRALVAPAGKTNEFEFGLFGSEFCEGWFFVGLPHDEIMACDSTSRAWFCSVLRNPNKATAPAPSPLLAIMPRRI